MEQAAEMPNPNASSFTGPAQNLFGCDAAHMPVVMFLLTRRSPALIRRPLSREAGMT